MTSLCQVDLIWEAAYGKDFTIDISDDAISWNTVATITGNTLLTNHISISGDGRYVRMNGTARGTGNGYSLYGMHVFGTAPSASCGGTDLALGATGTATSSENAMTGSSRASGYGYSLYEFTVNGFVALPVRFQDFTAAANDGYVKLIWATAMEAGNDYFEIERSTDGRTFTPIGTVAGKGNSSSRSDYEWIDHSPIPGTNYYRLKQVDLDKKHNYSGVISKLYSPLGDEGITLYPNPADDQVILESRAPILSASIYSLTGQLLQTSKGERVLRFRCVSVWMDSRSTFSYSYRIYARPMAGTGIAFYA